MFLKIKSDNVNKMINMKHITQVSINALYKCAYFYTAYCVDNDINFEIITFNTVQQLSNFYDMLTRVWPTHPDDYVLTLQIKDGDFLVSDNTKFE